MRVQGPCLILVIILWLSLGFKRYCNELLCVYDSVLPGLLLQSFGLVLPAEGMIVNLSFVRGLPGTLWRALCRFCLSSVRDRRAGIVFAQIP